MFQARPRLLALALLSMSTRFVLAIPPGGQGKDAVSCRDMPAYLLKVYGDYLERNTSAMYYEDGRLTDGAVPLISFLISEPSPAHRHTIH